MSTHRCHPYIQASGRERVRAGALVRSGACLLLAVCMGAAPLTAQHDSVPSTIRTDSAAARSGVTPRGAFLRGLALPGWGDAAIGAWTRGAFYFAAESATAWELFRTRQRLLEARRRVSFREAVIRQDAASQGITNADSIRVRLAGDAKLKDLRGLAGSRASQQQDWVALGIFLVFMSAADAYVSANLAHFPKPISVDASPTQPVGRMQLTVSVSVPDH